MIYAILLDAYQDQVDPEYYAVTYSGDLDQCQAQTNHDGRIEAWLKSDFVERGSTATALEGPTGGMDSGRIVGLDEVASSVWSSFIKFGLPLAALGAGVAGAIAIIRRRKPRARRRGRR